VCQRVLLGSGVGTARTSVVATWTPAIAATAVHRVAACWRDGPVRTAMKISTSVKMQRKSAAQTPTADTPTDLTFVTVTLGIGGSRTSAPVSIQHSSILIPQVLVDDTIRYDTGCYFNVRSKADMSRLNLPHGSDN